MAPSPPLQASVIAWTTAAGRMTPEERERFRQRMREHFGFGPSTPQARRTLKPSPKWFPVVVGALAPTFEPQKPGFRAFCASAGLLAEAPEDTLSFIRTSINVIRYVQPDNPILCSFAHMGAQQRVFYFRCRRAALSPAAEVLGCL